MFEKLKQHETGIIIASLIVLVVIIFLFIGTSETIDVSAEGAPSVTTEGTIHSENILVDGAVRNTITYANGKTYSVMYGSAVTPMFTTVQMTDWILHKSNELISIFQELAFPFCAITFILATFITLFGCLSGQAGQGILGMSASVLGYAAILYAPSLVNLVVIFVSN